MAAERDQLDIFYNLQTWLNSNSDIDFDKIFRQFAEDNSNLVTCYHFKEVLEGSGYDFCIDNMTRRTDFMCLIRAISCTQLQTILSLPNRNQRYQSAFCRTENGMINYKQFLTDIQSQPYKWWCDKLNEYLRVMEGQDCNEAYLPDINNITSLFPVQGSSFDKFCQEIVTNRLFLGQLNFTNILDSGKQTISKSSLRKYILSHPKLNMGRIDCHIFIKLLIQENKKLIALERNPEKVKTLR